MYYIKFLTIHGEAIKATYDTFRDYCTAYDQILDTPGQEIIEHGHVQKFVKSQ